MRAKIIAIFISCLFTLAAVEVFIRAGGYWKELGENDYGDMQAYPDGGFTFKPNLDRRWSGARWHTNSLGLRTRWEPSQMRSNCRKVLFVGGSITAGYGVDDDEAYPQQLQDLLDQSSVCHQIINAAQPAYTAEDVTWNLKRLLPLYKPDTVIWIANPFAMNGRSSATANGNLRSLPADNALADTLVLFWKVPGRYLDLTQPYIPPAEREVQWFEKSFAYRYFKPFWDQLFVKEEKCPSQNCLDLRPPGLPRYAAAALSPFQQQRLYTTAQEAFVATQKADARILFVTIDNFLESARLPRNAVIADLSEITGKPTPEIFERYNLRWDFHLNKRGNALVAEGFKNYLLSSAPQTPSIGEITRHYEEANQKVRAHYLEQIGPTVEPAAFKGIHQIVSGLKPDPRFSEANILLLLRKAVPSEFVVRGENFAEAPKKFRLQFPGTAIAPAEFTIPPGPFEIRRPVPELSNGLTDVRWTCIEESCDYLRYDLLGWERARE